MSRNRLGLALLGGLALAAAGCGERRGTVTGTVTLKSQPVEKAVINFFPDDGMPVAAAVNNGAYTIADVPYGNYRVSVMPLAESPAVGTGPGGPRKPGTFDPTAGAAPAKKGPPPIPAKYGSVDSSGLSCKVDQSSVTNTIALD